MNKIATLAKIANRLDSLGLTREADVLDAFIRKVAEDLTPPNPEGTAAPVASTDPATTTWEDGEYKYSYNPGNDQMFIVSGPGTTAPKQVTKTSNSTAYYAIRNQYEHKMGLPKTKPVLPVDVNDENAFRAAMTPFFNSLRGKLKGEWTNKAGKKYNNNPDDAKTTLSIKFNVLKDGTIDPKTCVVTSDPPEFAWFADSSKKIILSLKGPTLTGVGPVSGRIEFDL